MVKRKLIVALNNLTVIPNLIRDLRDPDFRKDESSASRGGSKSSQQGFSTIEILIAAAIMVVVFSAVVLLVLGGQKIAADTQGAHEAQLLAGKYLEEGRAGSILNFTFDVESLEPGSPVEEIYNVDLSQAYLSECVKEIKSRVDWSIEGRDLYVESLTYVTNPAIVFAQGTECNVPGGSQFAQCFLYGTADLEIEGEPSPNQDAYDLEVTRIGGVQYAFIVTHPSNSSQRPEDLWVYNISNQSAPSLVAHLDINAEASVGINSITVARSSNGSYYAYLANDATQNRLIIVDVSNPAAIGSPVFVDISGYGNNRINDIVYNQNKLYVGIGSDLRIYNAATPTAPTLLSSLNIGGDVNKISLNSTNLYLATGDNLGELTRVNIANNAVTKYNLNGNAANKPGTSIHVLGNRIYLGIQSGQNENNFFIIDDTAGGWAQVAAHNLPHQNNKKIFDHLVLGNFLFVLVQEASKEFQIYDISDVNNFVDKCTSTNPTNVGYGLDLFENFVYLSMRANSELQIYSDQAP
jgi:type II secretory pathway pseudopilin PulG